MRGMKILVKIREVKNIKSHNDIIRKSLVIRFTQLKIILPKHNLLILLYLLILNYLLVMLNLLFILYFTLIIITPDFPIYFLNIKST
jgi:hypothetical protein